MATSVAAFWRRVRRMWADSLLVSSKALTIVVLFEFVAVLFLALYESITHQGTKCYTVEGKAVACSVYYTIVISLVHIFNALFLTISAIDGIFYDNLYELYAAMFQALLSTGLGIFKFVEPSSNDWVDISFLVVTCSCQLFYFAVAYSLRQEYTWRLYRKAGADKSFRRIYKQLLIYKMFSKLDIMFGIVNVVSAGLYVLGNSLVAGIAWSMLVFHFLFHLIGTYAVNREITRLTMVYFGLFAVSPVYVIYMMYYMYTSKHTSPQYLTMAHLFTVTGILDLIVHICLFAFAVVTYRNYGRGLKDLEFLKKKKAKGQTSTTHGDDDELEDLDEDVDYVEYAESKDGGGDNDWSLFDVIRNTYAIDKHHHHVSHARSAKS